MKESRARITPVCAVCRTQISGQYAVSLWGRPYHGSHACCDSCARLMHEGVRLCRFCDASMKDMSAAGAIVVQVRTALSEGRGVTVPDRLTAGEVSLVGKDAQRLGEAVLDRTFDTTSGAITASATLHLERGQPAVQFASVRAHEITHAWLGVNWLRRCRVVDGAANELSAFSLGRPGGRTEAAYGTNRDEPRMTSTAGDTAKPAGPKRRTAARRFAPMGCLPRVNNLAAIAASGPSHGSANRQRLDRVMEPNLDAKTISVGDHIVVSWIDASGTITEAATPHLVRSEDINDGEIRGSSPLGIALLGTHIGETMTIFHGGTEVAVRVEAVLEPVRHG